MPGTSDYANELMARVGLDTTEWKKGVTDLDGGIRHIERSFQASAAVMGDWGNNADGLKMRVEILSDKLTLQKKKLEILNQAYQETVKEQGANSAAAESLAQKMYKASQEIQRSEAQIKKYGEQLKNNNRILEEARQKMEKFSSSAEKVGQTLTVGVTAPILAAGTAAYKMSSDLTEAINKADATFGRQAKDIQEWSKQSLESMGMARSTALDAAALYGDMATSMDVPTKAAAEMSKTLVSLSADLASFKNVSIEQAQNALSGVFTGETKSLKNLGIVMTETQLKAYALSKGIQTNYADMSQAEKVQLRYDYVLEKSKNAIGDYARTSGEAAGQMRLLPEALKELGSSFGENVAPTITPIINGLNNMIVSFGKLDNGTKKTIVTIAGVAAAVGPVTLGVSKTVSAVGKAITVMQKLQKAYTAHKTTTTVAATAEKGLSTSLTATGKSANVAAGGVRTFGTAVQTAMPWILAVTAALAIAAAAFEHYRQKTLEEIDERYDKLIDKNNEAHDCVIDNLENELETYQSAQNSKIQSVNTIYDTQIKNLSNNLKAEKSAIETEKKLYQSAHEERIKQLEAERAMKLSLIDTQENEETAALQKQIDAIDALTEAEDEAEKERQNAKRLAELEEAILNASSLTDRKKAQEEYTSFVADLEREKTLKLREEQKQQLKDQIDLIKAESDKKREQVNAEYEAAKQLEDDKYAVAQEGFEKRLDALDGYVERETEKLEDLRKANVERLQSETEAYVSELQKRIDKEQELKQARETTVEKARELEKELTPSLKDIVLSLDNPTYAFKTFLEWFMKKKLKETTEKIGANASGTDDWRGGMTRVNEEGGEIINLPRHTQIIPHDVSMEAAREYARMRAVTNNQTTNNTYHYGAQQRVTQVNIAGHNVADIIEPEVSENMAIRAEQRRRAGHAY